MGGRCQLVVSLVLFYAAIARGFGRIATAVVPLGGRVHGCNYAGSCAHCSTALVPAAAGWLLHRAATAPRCCADGAPELTGGQRRALRSHAGRQAAAKTLHYVNVADNERSRDEVQQQLEKFELVRCKFGVTKKAEAKLMASELALMVGAAVAEVMGHTALLYRPSAKRLIRLDE